MSAIYRADSLTAPRKRHRQFSRGDNEHVRNLGPNGFQAFSPSTRRSATASRRARCSAPPRSSTKSRQRLRAQRPRNAGLLGRWPTRPGRWSHHRRDRVRLRRRCPLVRGRLTRRCHLVLRFLACRRSTLASSTSRTVAGSGVQFGSGPPVDSGPLYVGGGRWREAGMSVTTSADHRRGSMVRRSLAARSARSSD